MKRLTKINQKNKWMLLVAVSIICLVAGFNQIGQATAATEQDEAAWDYLDPFTLQVLSMSAQDTAQALPSESIGVTGDTGPTDVFDFATPEKVWIPERPVFRSPCVPSWW